MSEAADTKPIHFLRVMSKEDAEATWHAALSLAPLGAEEVPLEAALGRLLAADVEAPIDVPPFDRSLVDGFAVRAEDTFGALEEAPARLRLLPEKALAGRAPTSEVAAGEALEIATGGVIPRGANAVQMVERTDLEEGRVLVYKPVAPGAGIQSAGGDMRAGETVLRQPLRLTSRETGVLAALGLASVRVWRRPRVAILSTGDELRVPGQPLEPGAIYDSNSRIVADAVSENGGLPHFLGIVPDDAERLRSALEAARDHDVVILSGGTSKGTGDLSFRMIDELGSPGILVHGVNLKPGKPIVLAAWDGRPVVVLPGFPTSAVVTFNLFVRPVIRRLAGLPTESPSLTLEARMPARFHSAPGRHEFALVHLVARGDGPPAAYPIPQASGSMSAFALADGYVEVPAAKDMLLAGETVVVTLLARALELADLTFIGSHCQGVDLAIGLLAGRTGKRTKIINTGSQGGVAACARGEADLAGIHLLDAATGRYNRSALADAGPGAALITGYRRRQGLYYRPEEFADRPPPDLAELTARGGLRLMNRNRGAGTRLLLDGRLAELARRAGRAPGEFAASIPGYETEARSHNAVAAGVAGGRADWGLGIEAVARAYGLGFAPLEEEEYDFLVPRARLERDAVQAFLEVLRSAEFRAALGRLPGFVAGTRCGELAD